MRDMLYPVQVAVRGRNAELLLAHHVGRAIDYMTVSGRTV